MNFSLDVTRKPVFRLLESIGRYVASVKFLCFFFSRRLSLTRKVGIANHAVAANFRLKLSNKKHTYILNFV